MKVIKEQSSKTIRILGVKYEEIGKCAHFRVETDMHELSLYSKNSLPKHLFIYGGFQINQSEQKIDKLGVCHRLLPRKRAKLGYLGSHPTTWRVFVLFNLFPRGSSVPANPNIKEPLCFQNKKWLISYSHIITNHQV